MIARLFGFSSRVDRGTYFAAGVSLMILKYLVEAAAAFYALGYWLTPWAFLSPLVSYRLARSYGSENLWFLAFVAVWSLPFIWIGVSMSVRRAVDANLSPWVGLLFFMPFVNFVLMLVLACLPTRGAGWDVSGRATVQSVGNPVKSALLAIVLGTAYGLGIAVLSIFGYGQYGATLFFGTPVVIGAVSGFVLNRRGDVSSGGTLAVAMLTVLLSGGFLALFALEGVVCLAMAAPLAFFGAAVGAFAGRAIALRWRGPAYHGAVVLAALPGVFYIEPAPLPTFEVVSVVDVAAPPETVWRNVIRFPELPPPTEWYFKTGIAYPLRARLDGDGVGATRYCEFSTGSFIEPVTAWVPNERLAFDVSFHPAPMKELSLFENVTAPHLDGYFRSTAGEFRLKRLPNGGTRLEGSTWYTLEIYPSGYWRVFADAIVHAIHRRVLDHIASVSVAER